jgi:hypothetical protein
VGDEEIEQILREIVELAYLLDWSTASVQTKEGVLVGMYIGLPEWLKSKIGTPPQTPTH